MNKEFKSLLKSWREESSKEISCCADQLEALLMKLSDRRWDYRCDCGRILSPEETVCERCKINPFLTEEERFMSYVAPDPNSGCWLWTGGKNGANGYGGFKRSPKSGYKWEKAHRAAHEMFIGPIPEGLVVDHLCRVRCCVNPKHLEAVTHKENSQRIDRNKRYAYR